MNNKQKQDATAEAKKKLEQQAYDVLDQIGEACKKVPRSIRTAPLQQAQNWKALAARWYTQSQKGIPARLSVPKMELFILDAKDALKRISTGM